MQKSFILQNRNVQVIWQYQPELLAVTSMRNVSQQKAFAGFEGLREMFDAFESHFSEQTDYDTAIEFFKPNVSRMQVGK